MCLATQRSSVLDYSLVTVLFVALLCLLCYAAVLCSVCVAAQRPSNNGDVVMCDAAEHGAIKRILAHSLSPATFYGSTDDCTLVTAFMLCCICSVVTGQICPDLLCACVPLHVQMPNRSIMESRATYCTAHATVCFAAHKFSLNACCNARSS